MHRIIYIIFLVFLCIPIPSLAPAAQVNPLLKCLGEEEWGFHRIKRTGPSYKLNQLFINEFASFDEIPMRKLHFDTMCNTEQKRPSLILLKSLLIDAEDMFDFSRKFSRNVAVNRYKKNYLKDLLNRIPHIFFNYLMQLQSLAPNAGCLENEIPEVKYYLERYKYLETDFSRNVLISDKKKIEIIFSRLRNLSGIFDQCRKKANKPRV